MEKSNPGRFFEDFHLGQKIVHATPRTVTAGDVALYTALYGARFALQSSDEFARACGLPRAPIDNWLVFHLVFGKTVPDISLNAVANLGYADGRWLAPVYPGETLRAISTVIGLKQTSSGKTGIVYVRSVGLDRQDRPVLDYVRWVLVRKRDPAVPAPAAVVPDLPARVEPERLAVPKGLSFADYDGALAGSAHVWDDYVPGERIDHMDGMTIEEAEHQLATRLYQNTARVHFDRHLAARHEGGRRLVYGGHIVSLARGLSFNGLGSACLVAAINGGRHLNPTHAGDTVYAWSEVLEKAPLAGHDDIGVLRLRTVATKNRLCADFPGSVNKNDAAATDLPSDVILDLDYWVLMPRR